MRKEALASCQLAGTQATLVELLSDEAGTHVAGSAGAQAGGETADVHNYLAALAFCRKEIKRREGPFPSLRLLHETHSRGLRRVRAKAVALLESLGVLKEVSGRKRDRTFSYAAYLELLGSGME